MLRSTLSAIALVTLVAVSASAQTVGHGGTIVQANPHINTGSTNVRTGDTGVTLSESDRPVSSAHAPALVAGSDSCVGSIAGGGQAMGFGLSMGTTVVDETCRRLKLSRKLRFAGFEGAANTLLCFDDEVRVAMEAAGTSCPDIEYETDEPQSSARRDVGGLGN